MQSPNRVQRAARVPPELAGERLDKAAATVFDEFSRTQVATWIRDGDLTVDGAVAAPKHRLDGGELLTIDAQIAGPARWDAAQSGIAFDIVYEDDDLIVVNKPPGVVVHPGAGNVDRTLINGLLAHRPALGQITRMGLVHRLDKDTGGLLLIAASMAAHKALTRAFARHDVARRYLAVVEGVLTGGRVIDAPIGRDPRNRLRQKVSDGGRRAVTRIAVRERFRAATLIEAELETGRTHQIRVHLASIGHPLVGDTRYGARGRLPPRPSEGLIAAVRRFKRQALHAVALDLEHPTSGAPLHFDSAVAFDLVDLIDALRRDRDDA